MSFSTRILELLPFGLTAWSVLGTIGTIVAHRNGDRPKARRNAAAIVAVWIVYAAVLLLTSHFQPQRILAPGQPECFDQLCYSVASVQSVGEFKGRGGGNLIQVSIRIVNQTDATRDAPGLEAYLVDATGRRWSQTTGLGGISLSLHLPPHAQAVSQPIFRVQADPPGVALVLTRNWTGLHWLVPGDTDSPFHRRTVLKLR